MNHSLLFCVLLLAIVATATAQNVDPSRTTVNGLGIAGGTVGVSNFFVIQPYDTNGNPILTCQLPAAFQVTLIDRNGDSVPLTMTCNRGGQTYRYQAKIANVYNLTIIYNNTSVAKSPYQVTLAPGPIYVPGCVATFFSPFINVAGGSYRFNITAYDIYGNRVYSCPPNYWTIVFSGILNITDSNYTCNSGVWSVSYSITRAGPYLLWVSAEKLNIKNSPFSLTINAGPIYARNTFAQVSAATAGTQTYLWIIPEDIYGNFIDVCSGSPPYTDWNVYLLSSSQQRVNLNISSCSNSGANSGEYMVPYTLTLAGSWQLYIAYRGNPISNNGAKIVVSALPLLYGPNLVATGSALNSATAGTPARFQIVPYDRYGNRINQCVDQVTSSNFSVTVTSKDFQSFCNAAETSCSPDDYTYTIQYTCQRSTNYSIVVQYDGEAIKNSPMSNLFVSPGPISGPATVVMGPGLTDAYAGEPALIELIAYDQYKNKITSCPPQNSTASVFVIDVKVPGTGIDIRATNYSCFRGSFSAYYTITQIQVQIYTLVINYQGNTIATSFVSTHPGLPYFANCKVTGRTTLTAGDYSTIQIQCSDQFNNPISSCKSLTSNNWQVQLNGPRGTTVVPSYLNCTEYVGQAAGTFFGYTVTVSGGYSSVISYTGSQGTYNTFSLLVNPAEFSPQNSMAIGLGVTSDSLSVDSNTTFVILSQDRYGNNVTNCSSPNDITVTIIGNDGSVVYPSVSPCFLGIIPVSYHSFKVGGYSVDIKYLGNEIKNSPYHVTWVAGRIYNPKCVVTGVANTTAGSRSHFTFYCEDQYGNVIYQCNTNLTTDWQVLLVTAPNAANFQGTVSSCSSGIYNGWWYGEKAGSYKFQINYLGQPIGGQTWSQMVFPGALFSNTSVATPTGLTGAFAAGATITFAIQGYDKFSNQISTCTSYDDDHHDQNNNAAGVISIDQDLKIEGVSRYISSVSTPSTFWQTVLLSNINVVLSTTSQCTNGVYTITYTYTRTGTFDIAVYGADKGSPINTPGRITINPGPAYPPNMWGSVSVSNNLVAGSVFTIYITARDKYDNVIPTCMANYTQFSIYARPQQSTPGAPVYNGTVTGCQAGNYTGQVQVSTPNVYYDIHAQFNSSTYGNNDVLNSPWTKMFTDGTFTATNAYATGYGVQLNSYLIAGFNQNFSIILANQYNVPIQDAYFCQSVNNNWTIVFSRSHYTAQFSNVSTITLANVAGTCDSQGILHMYYNLTIADYYTVKIYWNQNVNSSVLIGGGNQGIYSMRIRPGALIPTTIIIGTIPRVVYTQGNFTLVGFDKWGNLADFSGTQGSSLSINMSPHCVFNYAPVCTPGNSSYVCNFNASVGGIYCLTILYNNRSIGKQSVFPLLVQGGYQCSPACQNNGYCLVTNFPAVSNTTTNTTTNSTTNSTTNGTNQNFAGITTLCHCQEGYTGSDCSVQISKSYMRLGLAIGLIVGLALLLLVIGLIVGFFIARSRAGKEDYLNKGLIDN